MKSNKIIAMLSLLATIGATEARQMEHPTRGQITFKIISPTNNPSIPFVVTELPEATLSEVAQKEVSFRIVQSQSITAVTLKSQKDRRLTIPDPTKNALLDYIYAEQKRELESRMMKMEETIREIMNRREARYNAARDAFRRFSEWY